MPFYDDSVAAGLPIATPEPLPVTVPSAPFSRLFDAALRRDNIIGSITEAATQPPMGAFDPSFDPWAKLQGYEDHARAFIGANNDDDVLHIKSRIDKERRDRELMENGGWRGAAALLAAGTMDPVNLIPLGQVRAITRGGRALEGAIRGGAAFGAGTALQEVGLQGTQITRPVSESLMNIGSATVMGGVLGGAVGALTRPTMQTLRGLGDSSSIGGMIFDRELAGNLPGRRNLEEAAEVYDAPAIQRATAAAGGDVAKVAEDLRARIDDELSTGGIVEHRNQSGEKVRVNAIDEAGVMTDANGARLTLDDVTGPGHSLEIRMPADTGRGITQLVDDPLTLHLRGDLSAARAAEIRDSLATLDPTEAARLRAAGVPLDPELWKVIAANLEKAEASREGGLEVVMDQAQYLRRGGDLDTVSEREAFAVINRAMQAEVARGGDPNRFLDDAIAAGLGDRRVPGWVEDWKQRLLYALPTPAEPGRTLAGVQGAIADEVSRVLTAAGRPAAEARAYGALAQVRYQARAARLGTGESAEDLFRRDFPEVARGEAGGELAPGELEQRAPQEDTKRVPRGPLGTVPRERALTVLDILSPETPARRPFSRAVRDIADELTTRGQRALRALGVPAGIIRGPAPNTDEILSRAIATEVREALQRSGHAGDWYTAKVDAAMRLAARIYPEIATDLDACSAFTAALAVTSQGETVTSNVRLADQVYRYYRENGRFPTDVQADKQKSINANFRKLNGLLDKYGPTGTREFLAREFTVRQLEAETGLKIGGENKETRVYGSAILGPKIGQGFYQNLNGNYAPVTMDLWFMRAWGRLTGTLTETSAATLAAQRARLITALEAEGKRAPQTRRALENRATAILREHEQNYRTYRAEFNAGTRTKSEVVAAAERYMHGLYGINEAPSSGAQRDWIRARVNRARELLAAEGTDLTAADLQAAWWYPEKELYGKLGGRDAETINVDYATAWREVASTRGIPDAELDAAAAPAVGAVERRPGPAGGGADTGAAPADGRRGGAADGATAGEPGAATPAGAAEPAAAAGEPGAAAAGPGGGGGAAGLAAAQRSAAQAAAGYPGLVGLPVKPLTIGDIVHVPGPLARAKEAAINYMRRAGLIYDPPRTYAPVDRARAERIAAAFDEMVHAPDDPAVKASYDAMAKETLAQWEAIKETGLVVEWIKPGQADPYALSPRLAAIDVVENNHWWGYPTDLGYGTADATARAGNPMLQLTGEVIDGRPVVVNDIFRIVHDYFGHFKEGVGFRAAGEENAWRAHAAMYSELARGAMTAETRGQNSWVNYGPHGATNRTASAADTIYSPQKIGLLPEWVQTEGARDAAGELEQAGRGKIRLSTESERALITLFRDADASTFGHEISHHWLTELFTDAAHPQAPAALRKHADDVRAWLGIKEGEGISVTAQEKFATGFEQYLRSGQAPTPELASAFRQFRDWLVKIYQTITGLGEPISPEVRALFDQFLTVEEKAATPSAAGGSLSAASSFATLEQETIASALGIERALVRVSPTLRTGTSPSVVTRRTSMALADQPLDLKKNVEGIPTAQSAESLIKQFQAPLAEAEVGVDELFVRYRLGRSRRVFDIARLEARDMLGAPEGAMSYSEFRQAIGRAMRRGDDAIQPEVAEAAKLLRRTVFDPLKQRAIDAGLMPEDIDTKTAESYLMRVYDAPKIAAQRGQFSDVITRWLAGEQAKKDTIRTRVADLLDLYNDLTDSISRREGQIEGREQTLRETEIRREETSRFNAFAFRRSQQMSEPVDKLRADIRTIETQIAPQLARLEELRTAIAAEKDRFPQLREIDAAMYRLIGAGQKLKQGGELVDLVRDSDEVVSAIEEVRASVRGGIRELSAERTTARQALGAFDLVALEKARTDLGQAIGPYRTELRRLQGELRDEMARRGGPARGGAVFETEIRRRGNVLADQISGREAAIEGIEQRLAADQARIAAIRTEFEDLVTSWEGKTSQAAKSALARRAEAEATRTPEQGRLAAADKPVIDAAEAIANTNTRLDEGDLRDIARQIIDRILGSPVGRLPYDMEVPHPSGGPPRPDRAAPRGPLAQRSFMIPDELIEPWLESDTREIARMYTRTMAPDVVLAERFGRTDMEAQLQEIMASYEVLRQGKSEAEQTRLHNQMQADLRDIEAMRDRMRGTYALPADPNGLGNRAFHVIRDLNYLRLLGGMTISALPDMGRLVMQHGFSRVFGDAIVPMLTGWGEFRLAANEAKLSGTAVDMVLDSRAMSMADMLDDYGRWSKYERGLKGLTDRFGLVTLMAPWNSAMKQIAGVIGQTRTLEAIEMLVAGQPLRQAERTRLASLGIGSEMAEKIDAQFKAYGAKQDNGTWWANSQDWTDRDAIEAFRSALNKEIDTTIVTKGQEVPLWMSGGGTLLPGNVGKMIGQFRSFGLASAQRVMMAGLQKRDMATLNGALLMVGLGMMVYYIRSVTNQNAQPLPDITTPDGLARWLREGVDISGLTGYLFDVHNMIEKASGGGIGISRLTGGPAQSRYANRNTLESILGPTAGLVQDAGQLLGAATKGEWKAGDSSRVRRMIPFQNLIGLRHAFDAAEHGINQAFGIREPPPRR